MLEHPGKVNFISVNAILGGTIVEKYDLKYVPTVMVFKNGKVDSIYQKQYFKTEDQAYDFFNSHI
jgi:protein-disulfide isomerase-like protein with CxxC motif